MSVMTTAPRAALGSHLPVAGGLARALDTYAEDIALRDRMRP